MEIKSTRKNAIIDGVIRGFLFILITDYSTSVFYTYELWPIIISALLGLSIPPILFIIGCKGLPKSKIIPYWLISSAIFAAMIFILLLNNFTLHIKLLPLRELSNADGLIILMMQGAFLAANLLSRIGSCMACIILNARNSLE